MPQKYCFQERERMDEDRLPLAVEGDETGSSRQWHQLLRESSGLPWLWKIGRAFSSGLPQEENSQAASHGSHVPQRQIVSEFSSGGLAQVAAAENYYLQGWWPTSAQPYFETILKKKKKRRVCLCVCSRKPQTKLNRLTKCSLIQTLFLTVPRPHFWIPAECTAWFHAFVGFKGPRDEGFLSCFVCFFNLLLSLIIFLL